MILKKANQCWAKELTQRFNLEKNSEDHLHPISLKLRWSSLDLTLTPFMKKMEQKFPISPQRVLPDSMPC